MTSSREPCGRRPRRLPALAALLALAAALAACGEDEEPPAATLEGTWVRTSQVDETTATYRSDGTFEIVQVFNGQPFTPVTGTWSLDTDEAGLPLLIQESGADASRRRTAETFYVDATRLAVSNVYTRLEALGPAPEGRWQTRRVQEEVRPGDLAQLYRSSDATKTLTLNAGGSGLLESSLVREDPATGTPGPAETDAEAVQWSGASPVTLTGGIDDTLSLMGAQLVNLTNAYTRR